MGVLFVIPQSLEIVQLSIVCHEATILPLGTLSVAGRPLNQWLSIVVNGTCCCSVFVSVLDAIVSLWDPHVAHEKWV